MLSSEDNSHKTLGGFQGRNVGHWPGGKCLCSLAIFPALLSYFYQVFFFVLFFCFFLFFLDHSCEALCKHQGQQSNNPQEARRGPAQQDPVASVSANGQSDTRWFIAEMFKYSTVWIEVSWHNVILCAQ